MSNLIANLKSAGLKFREEQGKAHGIVGLADGRTHQFIVDCKPDNNHGRSEHDVTIPIAKYSAASLKAACEHAFTLSRGAVVLVGDIICYRIEIPADANGVSAKQEILTFCEDMDELEKKLTNSDKM